MPPAPQPGTSVLLPAPPTGASAALSAQTLAMAKFLGMNLQTDTQFLWIAQEALLAKLPEGYARKPALQQCALPEQPQVDGAAQRRRRSVFSSPRKRPQQLGAPQRRVLQIPVSVITPSCMEYRLV
jgi:hypothetical protein